MCASRIIRTAVVTFAKEVLFSWAFVGWLVSGITQRLTDFHKFGRKAAHGPLKTRLYFDVYPYHVALGLGLGLG